MVSYLFDEDLPTGSDDALRVTAIRNMYSAGLKSLTHTTDIISTDSQKAVIIEEVWSGVTAMKCHLKDRMPRSNGVVKSLASYKTFSRLRIAVKRLPIITDVQRLIRRCLDINVTILCNFYELTESLRGI
jgi:hypothetical protein